MACTPQEAELAQFQTVTASMRHWEAAIDAMLKKGEHIFHFTSQDFMTYLPLLTVRYFHAGWIVNDGGVCADGVTRRLVFSARQDITDAPAPTEDTDE